MKLYETLVVENICLDDYDKFLEEYFSKVTESFFNLLNS